MTLPALISLIGFAFVTSITPGPNNLMLMASGVNYGVRRTLPHMLGISIGFIALALGVGFGLAELFARFPVVQTILTALCLLYLLWLAYRIATAAPPEGSTKKGRPLTFLEAAAFQWVNPKAWAMAMTAVTVFIPNPSATAVLAVAFVFGLVNLPSIATWVALGEIMRRWLRHPGRTRVFNIIMAVLLVASTLPIVLA